MLHLSIPHVWVANNHCFVPCNFDAWLLLKPGWRRQEKCLNLLAIWGLEHSRIRTILDFQVSLHLAKCPQHFEVEFSFKLLTFGWQIFDCLVQQTLSVEDMPHNLFHIAVTLKLQNWLFTQLNVCKFPERKCLIVKFHVLICQRSFDLFHRFV